MLVMHIVRLFMLINQLTKQTLDTPHPSTEVQLHINQHHHTKLLPVLLAWLIYMLLTARGVEDGNKA